MPSPAATTSPTVIQPRPEGVMSFGEAMAAVLAEAKVTRLEWADPTIYLFLKNGTLSIHKADGTVHSLLVSDGDLAGSDWVKV